MSNKFEEVKEILRSSAVKVMSGHQQKRFRKHWCGFLEEESVEELAAKLFQPEPSPDTPDMEKLREKIANIILKNLIHEMWCEPAPKGKNYDTGYAVESMNKTVTLILSSPEIQKWMKEAELYEELIKELQNVDADMVTDGFGTYAPAVCPTCGLRAVYVCRPGDIRCGVCYDHNPKEYYTGTPCPECGMNAVHNGVCSSCNEELMKEKK